MMGIAWIFEDHQSTAQPLAEVLEFVGFSPEIRDSMRAAKEAIPEISDSDIVCLDSRLGNTEAGLLLCAEIRAAKIHCCIIWHSKATIPEDVVSMGGIWRSTRDDVADAAEMFRKSGRFDDSDMETWCTIAVKVLQECEEGEDKHSISSLQPQTLRLLAFVLEASLTYLETRSAAPSRSRLSALDGNVACDLTRQANDLRIENPLPVFGSVYRGWDDVTLAIRELNVSDADFAKIQKLERSYLVRKGETHRAFSSRLSDARDALLAVIAAMSDTKGDIRSAKQSTLQSSTIETALCCTHILHDVTVIRAGTSLGELAGWINVCWHNVLLRIVAPICEECKRCVDDHDLEPEEITGALNAELDELWERLDDESQNFRKDLNTVPDVLTYAKLQLRPSVSVRDKCDPAAREERWLQWFCVAVDALFERWSAPHRLIAEAESQYATVEQLLRKVQSTLHNSEAPMTGANIRRIRESLEQMERAVDRSWKTLRELESELRCPRLSLEYL